MASKTDIANWALLKLGFERVANIETEANERARVINQIFEFVRDSLIQEYPWNFCLKRATLSPSGPQPEWGFNYAYLLPGDYLAAFHVDLQTTINHSNIHFVDDTAEFVVEGNQLLTNEGPVLRLIYHRKVTDTNLFPPLFSEAMAVKLAIEVVERLTESTAKKDALYQEFSFVIDRAFRTDAMEGVPKNFPESHWLLARV